MSLGSTGTDHTPLTLEGYFTLPTHESAQSKCVQTFGYKYY